MMLGSGQHLYKFLIGWVVLATTVSAGEAPELMLSAEAKKIMQKAKTANKLVPFSDTWKLDWQNYWYKNYLPSMRERYPESRPSLDARKATPEAEEGGDEPAVDEKELIAPAGHVLHLRYTRFFKKPPDMKSKAARGNEEILLPDWRGYDYLWMDLSTSVDTHLWWAIEDQKIHPPVVANFDLKAGSKVTLQIDLGQAVKDRKLDLADMWYCWLLTNKPGSYELSNMRLVKRGTKADNPIVNDPEATKLPEYPTVKFPAALDIQRDETQLPAPVKITFQHPGHKIGLDGQYYSGSNWKTGGLAIFSPQHIMLLYHIRDESGTRYPFSYLHAAQTMDGGKTWTGINGEREPSPVYGIYRSPLAMVDSTTLLLYSEEGCNAHPGPRERINKFMFNGSKGWTFNEKMYVIGDESVHCCHPHDAQDFVRVPSGRIWAAYMIEGRWIDNKKRIQAKFSDTDGVHWHSWDKGMSASVPGMEADYPFITPYRDQVAILYGDKWVSYDGAKWSPPAVVPGGPVRNVATLGKDQIVALKGDGVYALSGGEWKTEWSGTEKNLKFCQAGQNLMMIGMRKDKGQPAQVTVLRRQADGTWTAPEKFPADTATGPYFVPRFSAPNCGVIAYNGADDKSIEIVLFPTTQK